MGDAEVLVVESDGVTPVAGASVGFQGTGAFGGSLSAFTDLAGIARFEDVPVGPFFVTATDSFLQGHSTGEVEAFVQLVSVTVQLADSIFRLHDRVRHG